MKELEYPFDSGYIMKKKRSLRKFGRHYKQEDSRSGGINNGGYSQRTGAFSP